MSTPKSRRTGDWKTTLDRIYKSLSEGTANKLFDDDYFIFELIKLLYEDTLEAHMKVQVLAVIEQYGSGALQANSVDQAVTALLDIFRDLDTSPASVSVAIQLLLTITTIFIDNEELMETELCNTHISLMMDLMAKLNNVITRRLRSCCCQCLIQLEIWKPGLLLNRRDTLARFVKEEKTDVCQDYMQLLITATSNSLSLEHKQSEEDSAVSTLTRTKVSSSQALTVDLLPIVSLVMDNIFLLTTAGLTNITCSVIKLVKECKDIPPSIFKPLMLQSLPTMDPCVICLMLHLQKHFRGEILSISEEKLLLKRAIEYISHPSLGSKTQLLVSKYLLSYVQEQKLEANIVDFKKDLIPRVFYPLDLHIQKLTFLIVCTKSWLQEDLHRELHYLTQLVETTGGMRVSCALYHVLYLLVACSSSEVVDNYILRITRKLFQNYPHLIPLIVDFLRAVKTFHPQCKLHSEVLSLLHHTVLSLPITLLLNNYHNYFHVWILSAQDSSVLHQKPLRKMLEIVREAVVRVVDDWSLGCMVLNICRTMMLHHHTDILYSQMGDILCFLMNEYGDSDIRDQARFFYALLTLNSDAKTKEVLGAVLMEGLRLGENIAEFFPGSIIDTTPAEIQYLEISPIIWNRKHLEIEYERTNGKLDYSFGLPATDGLEEYWDQLLYLKTSMKCSMRTCLVSESDFDSLVAVSFCAAEGRMIQLSDDVHLPYLCKKCKQESGKLARLNTVVDDWLFSSNSIVYTAIPKVPEPVTISVRSQFGHNRVTYECELPQLRFEFADFLLPFPWHNFKIPDKQQFFNSHWANYTEKASGRDSGVESVKILKCSRHSLMAIWENALISADNEQGRDTDDYMFFMPPRFHLLFHVWPRSTNLVLHIASDYWPVLGYLDHYLDSLI